MIYYVVYDRATGEERWRAADTAGAGGQAALPSNLAAIDVPQAAFLGSGTLDLAPLRLALVAQVDAAAEAARAPFLTSGEGQLLTYSYKADEARLWTADNTAATPFLTAEATARGMTIADLVTEVLGTVAAWTKIGAAIEGARMGAKTAIANADALPALAEAVAVHWAAVTTAALAPDAEPDEAPNETPDVPTVGAVAVD